MYTRTPTARAQVRNTMKTFEIKSASSSDRDVFEALTRDESDLVIDLNGFSRGERSSAMSSVPVSATYLGFPSSAGGLHDISITDSVATPVEISSHLYDESLLLFTSSSYMVSSHADAYPISHDFSINTITKQEHRDSIDRILELKRQGRLILCNFGQLYKITPNMVSAWADIMRSLPHSILWMVRHKSMNDRSVRNLRLELAMRGIDAKCRVIVSPLFDLEHHIEIKRLADLSLDSFPYVAHSTAVDILWSGVPHITLEGEMTPSRVASSLLYSLNMSELVTKDVREYVDLAIRLGSSPVLLNALREKIRLGRTQSKNSLFNTKRQAVMTTRGYEAIVEAASWRQTNNRESCEKNVEKIMNVIIL